MKKMKLFSLSALGALLVVVEGVLLKAVEEQKNSQVKQVGNQMTKKVGFSHERNRNRKDGQEWYM